MKHATAVLLTLILCVSPLFAEDISGPQSGTLGPGTYYVISNISVLVGDSLTIAPGTDLLFGSGCSFAVYGYLQAVGTEADSIRLISRYAGSSWEGIICYNYSSDDNRIEYCVFDGASCQAMELNSCSPTISHCRITNCEAGSG